MTTSTIMNELLCQDDQRLLKLLDIMKNACLDCEHVEMLPQIGRFRDRLSARENSFCDEYFLFLHGT